MRATFRLSAFLLLFCLSTLALGADKYLCPMKCEGEKTYAAPGTCPVCKMNLVQLATPAPDAAKRTFRLDFRMDRAAGAGLPVTLILQPKLTADAAAPVELEDVHERKMHLILVSRDLSFFAHEHPTLQPDGSLHAPIIPPFAGPFVLYADFKAKGHPGEVLSAPFEVQGVPPKAGPALKPNVKEKRTVGDVVASLRLTPAKPKVGEPVKLTYKLVDKKGRPVKDLEPYLGAGGHSVILSRDTTHYLHSHPEHRHGETPKSYGPEVNFETVFPKAGIYKAWAQFQRNGKVFTVDHVLDVK